MSELINDIQEYKDGDNKIAEIYLSAQSTVNVELNKFHAKLVELITRNNIVNIFSQKNSEIDVSILQILIASKKFAQRKNSTVFLNFHLSQTSKELINCADLDKVFKNVEL